MNRRQRELRDIVMNLRQKALSKGNRLRRRNWTQAPAAARPRRTPGAPFLPVRYRRRGFMLKVDPLPLSLLNDQEVGEGAWTRLNDQWLRALVWLPPRLAVEWDDGWVLRRSFDYPVVEFMACKGVKSIPVQVLEPGDPPADPERINAFLEDGLKLPDGRTCPVQTAEVTL